MYQVTLERVTNMHYVQKYIKVFDRAAKKYDKIPIENGMSLHIEGLAFVGRTLETSEGIYAEYVCCDEDDNEVYTDGKNVVLIKFCDNNTIIYTQATVSQLTKAVGKFNTEGKYNE